MEREWRVVGRRGSAQELHDLAAAEPMDARTVVLNEVTRPALVLGSTQDGSSIDEAAARAAGLDVARRRSGGGAVLLGLDDHIWVDLIVPSGDPLAVEDVERATWWLAEPWSRALGVGGRPDTAVHLRGVSDRECGRIACFAALGPGELTVGGRKVLGVSQRRSRAGARFQCVAYRRWDPEPLVALLGELSGPVENSAPDRVREALRSGVSPAVRQGWSVERDLIPVLP